MPTRADGFQIAVEYRVDDGGADALGGEIGQPCPHVAGTARQHAEIDQPNLALALARQHPHQV